MELNRNEKITFTSTTSIILSQEKNKPSYRAVIMVVNTSALGEIITISIDKPADVDGEGIPLSPGGYWIDSEEGGYLPTQRQINAKSSAATGSISLQERVIHNG
jgi:hypothetical protein